MFIKTKYHLLGLLMAAASVASLRAEVTVVTGPDLAQTNRFYLGNRAPLLPSQFISLPTGAVEPRGWVREFLKRQREG